MFSYNSQLICRSSPQPVTRPGPRPGPSEGFKGSGVSILFHGPESGQSTQYSTVQGTVQHSTHHTWGDGQDGGVGDIYTAIMLLLGELSPSPAPHCIPNTQCLVFNRCNKHHGRFTLDYLVAKGDCLLVLQLPSVSSTQHLIHNPHPRPEQDHCATSASCKLGRKNTK